MLQYKEAGEKNDLGLYLGANDLRTAVEREVARLETEYHEVSLEAQGLMLDSCVRIQRDLDRIPVFPTPLVNNDDARKTYVQRMSEEHTTSVILEPQRNPKGVIGGSVTIDSSTPQFDSRHRSAITRHCNEEEELSIDHSFVSLTNPSGYQRNDEKSAVNDEAESISCVGAAVNKDAERLNDMESFVNHSAEQGDDVESLGDDDVASFVDVGEGGGDDIHQSVSEKKFSSSGAIPKESRALPPRVGEDMAIQMLDAYGLRDLVEKGGGRRENGEEAIPMPPPPPEICAREICAPEICARKICAPKICAPKICP